MSASVRVAADGRCTHVVDYETPYPHLLHGRWYCGEHMAPGSLVRLLRSRQGTLLESLGRRPICAGPYCRAHGGKERATPEAVQTWRYLAPDCVGDDEKVGRAGNLSLASPDVYVVLRQSPVDRRPRLWRVRMARWQRDRVREIEGVANATIILRAIGLATGTMMTPVESHAAKVARDTRARWGLELDVSERPASERQRPFPWTVAIGIGSMQVNVGARATREEAVELGRAAWAARVEADVSAIRAARGGTLDWGIPVEPRTEPILLEPATGESTWTAAARADRPGVQP